MKIKENLSKKYNLKVWHLLIIIIIFFSFGKSVGNTKIIKVDKPVEVVKEIPASCDKEKKIIGLYDDVLKLDNKAFNLMSVALQDPFNSYAMTKATDKIKEIAAEKQLKLIEIAAQEN